MLDNSIYLSWLKSISQHCWRDGGIPYFPNQPPSAEATIHFALALIAWRRPKEEISPFFLWLQSLQNDDGSVGWNKDFPYEGIWVTSLFAVLAYHLGEENRLIRAVDFLLSFKSLTFEDPGVNNLNSRLVGWPWVKNTFSWVEPTSWAIIALKLAGQGEHPRVKEGQELLKDRCIPGGGWNYGNKIVYHNTLIPFMDTTALALIALSDSENELIQTNLEILKKNMASIESLYSLAWICICLNYFGINTIMLKMRIEEKVHALLSDETTNLSHLALAMIALGHKSIFLP